jgi:hypothetical protein
MDALLAGVSGGTALHSSDGRFSSFTLPSSSGFIYKRAAP